MNIKEIWKRNNIYLNIIICIYVFAFLIATSTHSYDLFKYGFLPYVKSPLWANIYWTSLTFLDPLSIIILFVNIRIGLIFYTLIIVSDVIINMYFTIVNQGFIGLLNIFMICQILFFTYIIGNC